MTEPVQSKPSTKPTRGTSKTILLGARRQAGTNAEMQERTPLDVDQQGRAKINMISPARRLLAQVLLGTGDTFVYQAPGPIDDVLVRMVNVDTVERKVTLAHTQSRVAAISDTNTQCKARPIEPGGNATQEVVNIPGMDVYEQIRGLCDSANKVAVSVYGRLLNQ